jgi:hypothetical protein
MAIAVRTRIRVRVISRLDDRPQREHGLLVVLGVPVDRPPTSGIHNPMP